LTTAQGSAIASTVAGLAAAFGSGAMTNSIAELEHAKCILVTGSNTTETHPVIATVIRRAVREHGAKLIVVDPRRIDLVDNATLWLRQRNGSDVAWMNGMMNVIVSENLLNREFIAERTEGFDEFMKVIERFTPERVEEISTIPADLLREAARIYATAESSSIIYSMGITQHITGTDNVLSVANLAMLTGQIGRPSTGVNPLRGQNNVQGACDVGALPNVYPGYQQVAVDAVREKFEKAWGRPLSPKPGLTVVEMVNALEHGKVKGLIIMGENPMVSDPNLSHVEKSLDSAEFLVVMDIFMTETAVKADVVLPAASFAEKEGTFTNTERRVILLREVLPPPGQARTDWEIICRPVHGNGLPHALQQRVGYHGRDRLGHSHLRRSASQKTSGGRTSVALPRCKPIRGRFTSTRTSSAGAKACSTPSTSSTRMRCPMRNTRSYSPPGGYSSTTTREA